MRPVLAVAAILFPFLALADPPQDAPIQHTERTVLVPPLYVTSGDAAPRFPPTQLECRDWEKRAQDWGAFSRVMAGLGATSTAIGAALIAFTNRKKQAAAVSGLVLALSAGAGGWALYNESAYSSRWNERCTVNGTALYPRT
jgi:hypothetical protein